jgi:3-hydroxyisobutyrate dehydrogenase
MSTGVVFFGLGNMGFPMALNLIRGGYQVCGHDVVPQKVDAFLSGGGLPVADIATAVREAKLVLTMLPADQQVEAAYLGVDGILQGARSGAVLIDSSTISPQLAKKIAAAASAKGLIFLDAPVSGGTKGAKAGTLTFMVGGTKEGFELARPYLEKMGKAIYHTGQSGTGQTVKMCNNMLLAILMEGTCEAIRLGIANGMDPKVLSDIMAKSSGRNWVLDVYNPCPGVAEGVPASQNYAGGFGVNLMLKDLGLAMQSAAANAVFVPLGLAVKNLYSKHSKAGYGELDFSSIFGMQSSE